MSVDRAGQTGGFAHPAQLVADEREPMSDWMPSPDHGLEVDPPTFGRWVGCADWRRLGLTRVRRNSSTCARTKRLMKDVSVISGVVLRWWRHAGHAATCPARGREFRRQLECELDLVATA